MTVEKVVCDECGRVKAEANHWHRIGLFRDNGRVMVEAGDLRGPIAGDSDIYFVHDLCGEQCFIKHVCRLLGMGGLDGTQ